MPERIPNGVAKRVVFRAILASDHFTPATAKTIAITISKNGGAFANPAAGATNATEISSGFYYFDLGTGDTGTNGPLAWRGAVATVDDVGDVLEVVNATNAGFTALPNVASGSAGAVITSGTGTAQLATTSGQVLLQTGTGTGQLDFTSGVVKANTTQLAGQTVTAAAGVTFPTSIASPTNITSATGVTLTATTGLGNQTANITGTVSTVTNLTNAPTNGDLTATMKTSVASAVLDATAASYNTAGTIGNKINSAASAGDPWSTAVPGAYAAGSAGYILGNGVPLSTTTQQSVADTILGRNVSGGSSAGRTVKQALHFIRNKWTVSAGTLTVYDTDDTTSSWTAAVTGTAGANPVTGSDPA
jgi:hypothetical protein